jgi:hypothetical protein
MSIESRRELELTREKLKLLEERLAALTQQPEANRRAHEWSVRSLTQTINQMKEEIARFESRASGAPQKSCVLGIPVDHPAADGLRPQRRGAILHAAGDSRVAGAAAHAGGVTARSRGVGVFQLLQCGREVIR